MNRRYLLPVAVLCICVFAPWASLAQSTAKTQPVAKDPDVVKGIAQVDEGDYEGAILTLDTATRRLAPSNANVTDLSQAYLYLGIAYMARGFESAAKAKFRAAIEQNRDLSLSPDKYPPKVIDAFEAAKNEDKSAQPPSPAPSTAAKKGGGSKGLLIAGGVVAVGGGVALAAGGGGGGSTPSSPSPTPSPTTGNRLDFSGTLPNPGGGNAYNSYTAVPTQPGTLEARATWTNGQIEFGIGCQDLTTFADCGGTYTRTSNTTATYRVAVLQRPYSISINNYSSSTDTFTFVILFP